MTKLFKPGSVTLIHGSAEAVRIKALHNRIRIVATDPPFEISNKGNINNTFNGYTSNKGEWDTLPLGWLEQLPYYLQPGGMFACFGVLGSLGALIPDLTRLEFLFQSHIVVHKTNPAPCIHRRMYTHANEIIGLWSYGRKWYFDYAKSKELNNNKQLHNVWEASSVKRILGRTRKHPSVLRKLLLPLSAPGEIVLDLFCGSGSILEVAAIEGRVGVGIDLDANILDKAQELLEEKHIKVNRIAQ